MTISEICQVFSLLVAAATFGVSIYNSWKIREVHTLTNSKMSEMITEVRSGSLAKGNLEGRAEERTEEEARKPT